MGGSGSTVNSSGCTSSWVYTTPTTTSLLPSSTPLTSTVLPSLSSIHLSSTASPSSSTNPLPSLSPTSTMEDTSLLTASIAMSVLALLFSLAMMALVVAMFYFLLKLRREVKLLRSGSRGGGSGVEIENGSSVKAVTRLDYSNNMTTEAETPMDQKPSAFPPPVTTPPQTIPQSPPPPEEEDLKLLTPTLRDGYDNVKLLTSLLPADLRTEEYLEGRPVELEEIEKMEEEEQRYEEIAMRKKREEESVLAVKKTATPSGEQDDEDEDEYTNPADAIEKEPAIKTPKKEDAQKKFTLSTSEHIPTSYTDVFDQLPTGKKEVVKQSKPGVGERGRETSETTPSPVVEKKNGDKLGRIDVCGYEDIEGDMFVGARSAPCQESPLSMSTGNVFGQSGSPQREKSDEKTELSKRYSHPHPRRDARKEMVEVNPHSRKPVTLSSGRRKQLKREQKGEEEEAVDGEREEGKENEPSNKSAEPSPTTTSKSKEFNVSTEGGSSQDYYAFVDMAGKHRYRAESDSMKREGSGAPKHYTVKERPPEEVDGKTEDVKT